LYKPKSNVSRKLTADYRNAVPDFLRPIFVVITHIFCARQKTKPQPRITRMRANFLNQFVKIREIRGKMLWL